jgi:hypothetical protein
MSAMRALELAGLTAQDRYRHLMVHEAGHAVGGTALGLEVAEIQTLIDEPWGDAGKRVGGYVQWAGAHHDDIVAFAKANGLENVCVMLLCGSVAEDLLLGGYVPGGYAGDFDQAARCFQGVNGARDDAPSFAATSLTAAKTLVRRHVAAITDLANDLILREGSPAGAFEVAKAMAANPPKA